MYDDSVFWGKELEASKGDYPLQKESLNKDTVFMYVRVMGNRPIRAPWGHLPSEPALRGYLKHVLFPSMFLNCFAIRKNQSRLETLSPRELLLETMERRERYIGKEKVEKIQALLDEFEEKSKSNLQEAVQDFLKNYNGEFALKYGLFYIVNLYYKIDGLKKYIETGIEEIDEDIFAEGEIGIEVLEEQIGMPKSQWFKQLEDAIGNEFLTTKVMKTLNKVRF